MTSSIEQYERRRKIATDPIWVMDSITNKFLENRNYYDGDFSNAIEDFLTLQEAKLLVTTLSKCTCCERHQVKRPVMLGDFQEDKSAVVPQNQYQHHCHCQCQCRHFSRHVCRTFRDIEDNSLP